VPLTAPSLRIRFDRFELDEPDARLRREGTPILLPPKAFAVLCTLARTPGVLVTKNDLLDAVWGHQHVSESVLKTTISELRAALGDDARQPRFIETASRRGYRFIGRTSEMSAHGAPAPPAALGPVLFAGDVDTVASTPSAHPTRLIGREAALVRLRVAYKRACAGERQLVWIAGEAGVGKTRLIESFVAELPGNIAAFGQCVEHFGSGEPYLPLLEAVKELCRREPELVPVMRAVAPTWLVQMPWLVAQSDRENLQREVAGAHPDRMVREMREMMDRYTESRPLVFVLEDLHWGDHGTLRMMEHFARRPRQVRILWIASFRLTQVIAEDHPLRALRQELRLHGLCDEILLEPFSESDVADYMASRMPATKLPEPFVRRLHAHTDGLPLFVANVADTLIAQAAGDSAALERWVEAASSAPLPVPDSLAGVIEKQILRLPLEAQQMLEAASVCGVDFRASAVAAMLGRDAMEVGRQCDDLVRRKFWLRHGDIVELADGGLDTRYVFLHALYQQVLYQRLSMPQRVQLHRQAAKWAESLRASGEVVAAMELASHYDRGHQFAPALKYYGEAAATALTHFAPREALDLTSVALQLLRRCPEGPDRMAAELGIVHLRGLASGQLLGIGAAETVTSLERARVLCDALPESADRALLLHGLGLARYVMGDYAQAREIAERVMQLGERAGAPMLLMCGSLVRGMVHVFLGENEPSRASMERGIALAEQMGNRIPFARFVVDPFVQLRTNISFPLVYLGYSEQALTQLALGEQRAIQLGQPSARMLSLWAQAMVAIRHEDLQKVAVFAERLFKLVEDGMLTNGEGPARWMKGWVLAHQGSPVEGFRLIREGYERYLRLGMYASTTETLGYAATALILAGDFDGAERQLDEAIELVQRLGERAEVPNLLLRYAAIARARGDVDGARSQMRDALAEARKSGLYFTLKCAAALCELPGASDEDFHTLRQAYAALPEGHDTPFAQRVARLLKR
jgi:DNA-binding winged helix-turn-helix (wHTH) protein/tetratricopeptide (TPR) repeat protein